MLKEALVRAIHDIKNRYTTTIIVMVDESGEGISEVATGSYYGWLAASHSQSVCELSSRRVDGDGWGDSLKNLIYNISDLGRLWLSTTKWLEIQNISEVREKRKCFPNDLALQLVYRLLTWASEDLLSVYDALQHLYFQSLPRRCAPESYQYIKKNIYI
ncbi:uncharacterized protein LOC114288759 [Camellia sinensis]|uniref:uncharacterized protein LOC114288759 n=1 Tax=Camellia sinensis TaxID=4442 RepID=UPI0010360BD3|nr:uncharacterized protein LOC114288759 [Camellia sinensis]